MTELPDYLEDAKETARTTDETDLPRDTDYNIVAYRPTHPATTIATVTGFYHAQYVRDTIAKKHGFAGVSFGVEEA